MSNEIANQIDPMREFQEKLKQNIREDIAKLLPEEALNKLIEDCVKQTFFKPNKVKVTEGYREKEEERPSWFVQEVAKVVQPMMKERVNKFVEDNHEKIKEEIDKFLQDQNLLILAITEINRNTQNSMNSALYTMLQQLQQLKQH